MQNIPEFEAMRHRKVAVFLLTNYSDYYVGAPQNFKSYKTIFIINWYFHSSSTVIEIYLCLKNDIVAARWLQGWEAWHKE